MNYEAYLNEEDFRAALLAKMSTVLPVRGIHVTGERYSLKVEIEVVKS